MAKLRHIALTVPDPESAAAFYAETFEAQANLIERNGGSHFMDLPVDKHSLYFEAKFRDPNGVIFDISENGWIGATR